MKFLNLINFELALLFQISIATGTVVFGDFINLLVKHSVFRSYI